MRLMQTLSALMLAITASAHGIEMITLPGASPLVTFRIVFRPGSASDPDGKKGAASLTAAMLTQGGTKHRTYKQIVDAMYPMATSLNGQVDKEMITFSGVTHVENLEAYYALIREMLLEPGWHADDLKRLRDDQINYLRVSLRGNNEEELGKEVLYNEVFAGHPYGHNNAGDVSDLQGMSMKDLQQFYARNLAQSNLTIGLAGGYPKDFPARVQKDFSKLPQTGPAVPKIAAPQPLKGWRATLIEKQTRSVAFSIGHPITVRRGHPDFAALLVAQAYFGQHRNSWGRLFTRMREERGLNYGDYAYIEYFPNGMFQFEPDPNLARQQQIFQIWIRPVEAANAHFALRLAMYEFDRLIKEGIPEEGFEASRSFLAKNVNVLTKTKAAELGYAIDSRYYAMPEFGSYLKAALAKLTRDEVNGAIRRHLQAANLQLVAVGQDMASFKARLLSGEPSPMKYNSPKPDEILREDKIVAEWKLPLQAEAVRVVPVETVFE